MIQRDGGQAINVSRVAVALLSLPSWTSYRGRTRSAVAANVTGTGGQRSDLARRGARYPTAAAEQG